METMPLEIKEMIRSYMTPEAVRTMSETNRFWRWFTNKRRIDDKAEAIVHSFLNERDNQINRAITFLGDVYEILLNDDFTKDEKHIEVEETIQVSSLFYSPEHEEMINTFLSKFIHDKPYHLKYSDIQELMDMILMYSNDSFPDFRLLTRGKIYSIFTQNITDPYNYGDRDLQWYMFMTLVNTAAYDPSSPFYRMEMDLAKDTTVNRFDWLTKLKYDKENRIQALKDYISEEQINRILPPEVNSDANG